MFRIGKPFFLRKAHQKKTLAFLLAAAALELGVVASGALMLKPRAIAEAGEPVPRPAIRPGDRVPDIDRALPVVRKRAAQGSGDLASLCLDPCDLAVARGKGAPKMNALALMYRNPGPKDAPLALAMGLSDTPGVGKGAIGDDRTPPNGFSSGFIGAIAGGAFPSAGTPGLGETPPPTAEVIPPTDDATPPGGETSPPVVDVLPPIELDPPGDGDIGPPPIETPLPGAFALFLSAIAGLTLAKRRRKS